MHSHVDSNLQTYILNVILVMFYSAHVPFKKVFRQYIPTGHSLKCTSKSFITHKDTYVQLIRS